MAPNLIFIQLMDSIDLFRQAKIRNQSLCNYFSEAKIRVYMCGCAQLPTGITQSNDDVDANGTMDVQRFAIIQSCRQSLRFEHCE